MIGFIYHSTFTLINLAIADEDSPVLFHTTVLLSASYQLSTSSPTWAGEANLKSWD